MKKKCLCALFLLVLVVLSAPAAAEIYLPIWGTLKARAGSSSQSADDLFCNSVDLDSSDLSCNRSSSGGDYIYSITFKQDFDGDGFKDTLKFDLRVEAFEGSTYYYSETAGASSMTALGASTDVTDIGSRWGVDGDYDIDEGESLRFSVENIDCSAGSVTFEGLTSIAIEETNAGHSHKYIPGQGTGLDSGTFNSPTSSCGINDADANVFVITGAGSNVASRQWAVSAISFMFKGPLTDWDPTDYSYYTIGPYMLDEYPAQEDFSNYPEFSWDTVPRWLIARKEIAWTDDEIEALATYPLIVFEKANGAGFDSVEEGIIDTSTRVKAINPSVKSIFYRNSGLHYKGYASDATYDEWNWSLHTYENGEEVLDLHKGIYCWYNTDIAEMRDWWVYDAGLPTVLNDAIDGIFYDKAGWSGYIFDQYGNPTSNKLDMLHTLGQELPAGKLVIGNTLRNERGNGSRDLMRIMEGSYLERWSLPLAGAGQIARIDGTCVSMQLMMEASSKGKIILFKTGANSGTKTRAEMQADMPYHLALYLIVAEPYSYFAFQDTVAAHKADYQWETSWMPEFSRPLGPPLGQAIRDGYVYTRSFEHLDVWVDVETEETVLAWDSVDSDSDGMDDLWEYRNFGDTTSADPSADPDGDGYNNLVEYHAGTDPNVPEGGDTTPPTCVLTIALNISSIKPVAKVEIASSSGTLKK